MRQSQGTTSLPGLLSPGDLSPFLWPRGSTSDQGAVSEVIGDFAQAVR